MAQPWLRLARSIDRWRWRDKPATFSAWIWLLSHADAQGRAPWREAQIMRECGITRQQARTALKHMTAAPAEIAVLSGGGERLAQVLNWQRYNGKHTGETGVESTPPQPKNNQKTTKRATIKQFLQEVEEWKVANAKKGGATIEATKKQPKNNQQ